MVLRVSLKAPSPPARARPGLPGYKALPAGTEPLDPIVSWCRSGGERSCPSANG